MATELKEIEQYVKKYENKIFTRIIDIIFNE